MKIPTIVILISVLIFSGLGKIEAQEKITLETTVFPVGFEGDDPAVLYKNITALLNRNKAAGKTAEEILKGKPIYKNLTTDAMFAFSPESAETVSGRVKSENSSYRGSIFPLLSLADFPAPQPKYLTTSVRLGYSPFVSSPYDLVSEFVTGQVPDEFWSSHYLPVKTVYPAAALAKKYVGRKADCTPLPWAPDAMECDGEDLIIPSPQIHYGISFVGRQPFSLVQVSNGAFSLKTYKTEAQEGAGIVAWVKNSKNYGENDTPIFIVKLAAPYHKSESFRASDPVERKPYQSVRKILYVNLVAIWIYDRGSGKIVSKEGEKPDE